jgi:hypothetical protein
MRKHKILEVDWIDSAGYPNWTSTEGTFLCAKCKTIGYLIQENEESISLAQSKDDGIGVDHIYTIPKSVIKKRRVLR